MSDGNVIHVSIGEVKVGRGDDVLMTSLGSCVGIAFFWPKKDIYGLAHCLSPDAPENTTGIGARFVSQAIPSLMTLMEIQPRDRREVTAVLAGGGNMTAPKGTNPKTLIGALNSEAAEKYIRDTGIQVVHRDFGGETGRKLRVFCATGEYTIKLIPRILSPAS